MAQTNAITEEEEAAASATKNAVEDLLINM